jgi:hypothetical protein
MEELEPPQLADLPEEAESPRGAPQEPEEPPVVVVKAKAKARAKAKPAPKPPTPEPPTPEPEPVPEPPKPKARAKAKAKAKAAPAPAPAPTPEATPEPTFPTFNDPVALLAAALHSAREQESQRRLQLYETFVFGKR